MRRRVIRRTPRVFPGSSPRIRQADEADVGTKKMYIQMVRTKGGTQILLPNWCSRSPISYKGPSLNLKEEPFQKTIPQVLILIPKAKMKFIASFFSLNLKERDPLILFPYVYSQILFPNPEEGALTS